MALALFLDMLGTSQALSKYPDDHEFPHNDDIGDTFTMAVSGFRRAVALASNCASDEAFIALFSDCMYFVSYDTKKFCKDVSSLLFFMRSAQIPFRGGIGSGNFHFAQTSNRSTKRLNFNESSFFGTSIVRAHRAESCGLKGIRVFVHQSAASELVTAFDGLAAFPRLRMQTEEDSRPPTFGILTVKMPESEVPDVQHEVNYIGDESFEVERRRVDMIERMFETTGKALTHYTETREFLKRMESKRTELKMTWDEAADKYGFWP